MSQTTKTMLIFFAVLYIGTVALFLVGFFGGAKFVIEITGAIILLILLLGLGLLMGPMISVRRIYSKYPPRVMYDAISSKDGYCRFSDIPKWFILAVKCGEDHLFFKHRGINYNSIFNAFVHNTSTGGKVVGGSTITQQLIKNVYLTPEVTLRRKICEFLMVRRVEKELSKNEIIELYVNVIYYGFGIYGISAAAEHYFQRFPSELTFDQCLSLAAILPCPDKYNKDANPVYFYQVRQKLLRKILYFSNITFEQLAGLYYSKGQTNISYDRDR